MFEFVFEFESLGVDEVEGVCECEGECECECEGVDEEEEDDDEEDDCEVCGFDNEVELEVVIILKDPRSNKIPESKLFSQSEFSLTRNFSIFW